MQLFIKIAPRVYNRLRAQIPTESAAHEAIEKATRIDHSLEGVLFAETLMAANLARFSTIGLM
jgi:hypothetical protein